MLKNMYQKTKSSINRHQARFDEKKTIGAGIRLFFLYLTHSVLHAFALLFTSPEKCFVMATNKDPKGTWSRSYYKHLLFQRRIRLYSTTSFFTIIIAVVSGALAFNILFPPTEIKFASAAGTTYTVGTIADTNNGICVGSLSLREALACAGAGDTVEIPNTTTGTLILANAFGSLEFAANNVTLTSHSGFIIDGSWASPVVDVNGKNNITINNLVISNPATVGIKYYNATGGSVSGVTISNAGTNALVLNGSESITVENSTFTNATEVGILVYNSDSNTISNNSVGNSGYDGIALIGSIENTLTSNDVDGAGRRGIYLYNSSNSNTVDGNTVRNSTFSGIKITSSNSNTISDNTASLNTQRGVAAENSDSNTISGNTLQDNGDYGAYFIINSSSNTISGNTISGNGTAGAYIDSSCAENYFYQNTVVSQSDYLITETDLSKEVVTAERSKDNDKVYLEVTADSSLTDAQVVLGTMDGGFAEYLDDITLSSGFEGAVDCTTDDYFQVCILPSDANNTTYSEACLELMEDQAIPEVSAVLSSAGVLTITGTDDLDDDLDFYYTLDGTIPTTSSTAYQEPVTLSLDSDITIKAIAVDNVEQQSDVYTLEYTADDEEKEEDTTAPIISSVKATSITDTTATITWTTNEAATSVVRYGKDEDNLANSSSDTTLKTSHSLDIIGLDPETKYYYKVKSADASNNLSSSEIKYFTTLDDTTPVILSPEEGDIVYTQKPTISGTAPAEAELKLYMDGDLNKEGVADEDGEFSIQAKKISADEHVTRVKNKETGERSERVTFTVATTETTDDILLSGNYKNTANTTNLSFPNLVGNFYINGYSVEDFTVQVFIDDQLYGVAEIIDSNTEIASFAYKPSLKLTPGTHEAYFKVLRDSQATKIQSETVANSIVTETSKTRTFYVNGHPAPTLRYRQGSVLMYSRSNDRVILYLNEVPWREEVMGDDESGVAGAILDVSTLTPGTYNMYATARSQEVAPESKESDSITFTITAPVAETPVITPAPVATPVVEDEEGDEVSPEEVDTDEDGVPDAEEAELGTDPTKEDTDGDGWTDKEEEILGQDPTKAEEVEYTKEEVIKKKEIVLEELAAEEKNAPKQYPLIGESSDLPIEKQQEIKQELEKSIKNETKIGFTVENQYQEAGINAVTGQAQISFPRVLDIGDAIRGVEDQTTGELTFSGNTGGQGGYAILTIKSDPVVRIAEADENGQWTLSVPVEYLPEGEHTAYLQTEVNGVQTEQVQIARFVLQEQERFSNTTIFFLANIALAIFVLLLAIFLQLRKNRKLIEEMEQQA